jgi:hypothetical protein
MGLHGSDMSGALGQLDFGFGPALVIVQFFARHFALFFLYEEAMPERLGLVEDTGYKTKNARPPFLEIALTWIITVEQFPADRGEKKGAEWRPFMIRSFT